MWLFFVFVKNTLTNCHNQEDAGGEEKDFHTGRAGLSICLKVDASGTRTAVGFGSRSQKTEVTTASVIHRTRVAYYKRRNTKNRALDSSLIDGKF